MAVLANRGEPGEGGGGSRRGGGGKDGGDCFKIVKMIMERNFAPVIVFSFSKKECEAYALQMSKLDFNTRKIFSRLCQVITMKVFQFSRVWERTGD